MSFSIIAALVCVIVLSIFAYQNGTPVQLTFIYWTSQELPIWSVIIGAFLAGGLITYLLDTARVFKAGRNLRQESKKSRQQRKEIKELRAEVERLQGKKKGEPGTAAKSGGKSAGESSAGDKQSGNEASVDKDGGSTPSLEKKEK